MCDQKKVYVSAVDLENLMKNTHEVTEENAELFSNFDVRVVPSAYVYNVPVHQFFSSCIESYLWRFSVL